MKYGAITDNRKEYGKPGKKAGHSNIAIKQY
jgi:hypothetical protein